MPDAEAKGDAEMGKRLRQLRLQKSLTLQQVSKASGVSISTISKVEKGQVSPAYGTLRKIADGLEIRWELLITGEQATAAGRWVVTRQSDTLPYSSDRYGYLIHSKELLAKAMVPLEMHVEVKTKPGPGDWSSHDGEEFIFVIDGTLNVFLENYEPIRLERGESAYIDSRMRHAFASAGRKPARILSICYDPHHRDRDGLSFFREATARRSA